MTAVYPKYGDLLDAWRNGRGDGELPKAMTATGRWVSPLRTEGDYLFVGAAPRPLLRLYRRAVGLMALHDTKHSVGRQNVAMVSNVFAHLHRTTCRVLFAGSIEEDHDVNFATFRDRSFIALRDLVANWSGRHLFERVDYAFGAATLATRDAAGYAGFFGVENPLPRNIPLLEQDEFLTALVLKFHGPDVVIARLSENADACGSMAVRLRDYGFRRSILCGCGDWVAFSDDGAAVTAKMAGFLDDIYPASDLFAEMEKMPGAELLLAALPSPVAKSA